MKKLPAYAQGGVAGAGKKKLPAYAQGGVAGAPQPAQAAPQAVQPGAGLPVSYEELSSYLEELNRLIDMQGAL